MQQDVVIVGIDLVKNLFQVHAAGADGTVPVPRQLRRGVALNAVPHLRSARRRRRKRSAQITMIGRKPAGMRTIRLPGTGPFVTAGARIFPASAEAGSSTMSNTRKRQPVALSSSSASSLPGTSKLTYLAFLGVPGRIRLPCLRHNFLATAAPFRMPIIHSIRKPVRFISSGPAQADKSGGHDRATPSDILSPFTSAWDGVSAATPCHR